MCYEFIKRGRRGRCFPNLVDHRNLSYLFLPQQLAYCRASNSEHGALTLLRTLFEVPGHNQVPMSVDGIIQGVQQGPGWCTCKSGKQAIAKTTQKLGGGGS